MDYSVKIARNVASLPRSGIRDFFELVQGREGIISLGVGEPDFAPGSGFLAIGAPLERSLEAVGQRLLLHLALIAGIALVSALIARFYIYRLIEVWAAHASLGVDP